MKEAPSEGLPGCFNCFPPEEFRRTEPTSCSDQPLLAWRKPQVEVALRLKRTVLVGCRPPLHALTICYCHGAFQAWLLRLAQLSAAHRGKGVQISPATPTGTSSRKH